VKNFKLKKADINPDTIRYEVKKDLAKESHTLDHYRYYIDSDDLQSEQRLRLFIEMYDESTMVYYFDDPDAYYLKYYFKDYIKTNKIKITSELICKFCIVEVTEPGADKNDESFLRIKLKPDFYTSVPISLEHELYNNK